MAAPKLSLLPSESDVTESRHRAVQIARSGLKQNPLRSLILASRVPGSRTQASRGETAMAKGQMRSTKEKKKPKQDKNKKPKGGPAPSPFAGGAAAVKK